MKKEKYCEWAEKVIFKLKNNIAENIFAVAFFALAVNAAFTVNAAFSTPASTDVYAIIFAFNAAVLVVAFAVTASTDAVIFAVAFFALAVNAAFAVTAAFSTPASTDVYAMVFAFNAAVAAYATNKIINYRIKLLKEQLKK